MTVIATGTQWFPVAGKEAEARFQFAFQQTDPTQTEYLTASNDAAFQYALDIAYAGESCLMAAGVEPWPEKILPIGIAEGKVSPTASPFTTANASFGSIDAKIVKMMKGVDPLGAMTPTQAAALHYLACQRALRKWVHSARPWHGALDVDLIVGGGESGGPTLPGGAPELPSPGTTGPTVPGSVPQLPGSLPNIFGPQNLPQGGNVPGLPGFDPTKPIVLPGPGQPVVLPGSSFGAVELGQTIPANLFAIGIVVTLLGAAAIAAYAWVEGKKSEGDTAVKLAETKVAAQCQLAADIAAKSIAAGIPVDIPDVVRQVGGQELNERRYEPYLLGFGAAATAAAALLAYFKLKGV